MTETSTIHHAWHHPSSFYCPIAQQCMSDPVMLADGHSYERADIERWLCNHATSPVSGVQLPHRTITANHALRNAIEEYFQQIFQVHRRAIRRTFQAWNWSMGPGQELDKGSNATLLRTIDALMQCALLMNAKKSLDVVLQQVVEEAKAVVGAEVGMVFLVDATGKHLVSTMNDEDKELRLPVTEGIIGHVVATGESVLCDDAYADARFDKRLDMELGCTTEALICVPLVVQSKSGDVRGVIQLCNKMGVGMARVNSMHPSKANRARCVSGNLSGDSDGQFTPQDLAFLQLFAGQAATTIVGAYPDDGGDACCRLPNLVGSPATSTRPGSSPQERSVTS